MKFDQKVLVVRFSSIGDIVQSTSPLKTIRNAYPDAQITFLTLDDYAPILELHPDIDFLLSIKRKKTLKEIWDLCEYIEKKEYSFIFDLHNSIRSNILLLRSKGTNYKIKKPRINRFLLFFFHFNRFNSSFSSLKMFHEHIGAIWKVGDKIPPTSLFVSQHEKAMAKSMLISKGVFDQFIAVVPGAAWKQKQWSVSNYIETLNQIDLPCVLIGSKTDKICEDISLEVDKSINLIGKTDLRLALAILSNAEYIIGSDTGLLHAAEALGKSVSMILGPTSRQTGAGVHLDNSIEIEKDIWCRPCSQNGKFPCYRKTQLCMDLIKPSDVIESILKAEL
ncbi:MAG: hypothetical protein CMG55_06905 [Candidatus Marinimicrobia bacterium]|nr:hypothetical protein [Candidatus Neomarinimicrobiota bacterium]|tara:strand:- start:2630 stop:3634 length:1005 start_codon:yes stop_codon:yes gene_type:complete